LKVVFDIECNRIHNPDKIWCIVCKDINTDHINIFRNLVDDEEERKRFVSYSKNVKKWIGHNVLGYDIPIMSRLINVCIHVKNVVDTLILSKLVDYSRIGGHSIEQYGLEFGLEKIDIGKAVAGHNPFFDKWSQAMEDYCVRDVNISHLVYTHYLNVISDPKWHSAIALEQRFQQVVNDLHDNGFGFDLERAKTLLDTVSSQ